MRAITVFASIITVVCSLLLTTMAMADYNLGVNLVGIGVGSVNSLPSVAISCTYPPQEGKCSTTLTAGTILSLVASPGRSSLFGGWSGSCSGCYELICPITLDSNINCIATFTSLPPVMINGISPVYHPFIQDALNTTTDMSSILIRAGNFKETLSLNRPVTLVIHGGFDASFSSQTGYSVLNGSLTLRNGTAIIDRLVISAPLSLQGDITSPTVPADVAALPKTPHAIDVRWDASSDNVGVAGYEVYRDGTKIGITAANSFSDAALSSATKYCYSIFAYDSSGNRSSQSAQSCATTLSSGALMVALNAEGVVQSTITMADLDGTQLVLQAGSPIALIGDDGTIQTPASLNNVYLSLVSETGVSPSLQQGIGLLTKLRIVLTVDGTERNAFFGTTTSGEPGLKLNLAVSRQSVTEGTFGLLFGINSGKAVRIGSSALTSAGENMSQMQFSPASTGTYLVGGSPPGVGTAPADAFWSSFTVVDPGCVSVKGTDAQICGPSRVDRIMIEEESTKEILADCFFGTGTTGATGPSGTEASEFWCEQNMNNDGSIRIKVSSRQANLPWIRANFVRVSDRLPVAEIIAMPDDGLHGPNGTIYTDPYQHKEFQFAGFKELNFTSAVGDYKSMRLNAYNPLYNAKYFIKIQQFQATNPGYKVLIPVFDTLDARVLIEENVILKDNAWKVRKDSSSTRGNRGTYIFRPKQFKGTATTTSTLEPFGLLERETSAMVTFQLDPDNGNDYVDRYVAKEGSVTQTIYTVPEAYLYGLCYGDPVSITKTYTVNPEFGFLAMMYVTETTEYAIDGIIPKTAPVSDLPYKECCPNRASVGEPICQDRVITINQQTDSWLYTPDSPTSAGDVLKGSVSYEEGGAFEWNFVPVVQ